MSVRRATFIKELLFALLLKACMEVLGMEDGRIPDSAISASSFYSEGTHSNQVRSTHLLHGLQPTMTHSPGFKLTSERTQ